jgi:1,4-dihydroxy-2-naphthoyl-CoA synthase
MGQKEAFQWTTRLSGELFSGDEAAEGMAAFLGKRKPEWASKQD